ncbi:MAG: hypothetical protein JXR83_03715 [Deltaproteobacteria bacterium]|nr:hypothetical protein [Deltaproteobacteria bacterium]
MTRDVPGKTLPREAATRVLSFVGAGLPLVTPITGVERVVEERALVRLPFACRGLVGLLPYAEAMVPLYDLEAFASQRRAVPRDCDNALAGVMPTPLGRIAVRFDRLSGLFPSGDPMPGGERIVSELPLPLQPCIGGATQIEGLVAFFFAPDLFVEQILHSDG